MKSRIIILFSFYLETRLPLQSRLPFFLPVLFEPRLANGMDHAYAIDDVGLGVLNESKMRAGVCFARKLVKVSSNIF